MSIFADNRSTIFLNQKADRVRKQSGWPQVWSRHEGYGLSENAQCETTIWFSGIDPSVHWWLASFAQTGSPRQTGRTLLSRFSKHLDDERLANHRQEHR